MTTPTLRPAAYVDFRRRFPTERVQLLAKRLGCGTKAAGTTAEHNVGASSSPSSFRAGYLVYDLGAAGTRASGAASLTFKSSTRTSAMAKGVSSASRTRPIVNRTSAVLQRVVHALRLRTLRAMTHAQFLKRNDKPATYVGGRADRSCGVGANNTTAGRERAPQGGGNAESSPREDRASCHEYFGICDATRTSSARRLIRLRIW